MGWKGLGWVRMGKDGLAGVRTSKNWFKVGLVKNWLTIG